MNSPQTTGESLPKLDDLLAGGKIRGARPYQEDDFRISDLGGRDPDGCDLLMVVADGLGGHAGGAEASRVAVNAFVETFVGSDGGVTARLRASLDAGNAAVRARSRENDYELMGMGCTLVGCVVDDQEEAHWISVGDSPLWRVRARADGGADLDRLNEDHSMKPVYDERVRRGEMTEAEAARGSHMLQSAVMGGRYELLDAGAPPVRLQAGDRLLAASDGVESLSEDEIGRWCGGDGAAAEIVAGLLADVDAKGVPGQDNATAVLYRHVERSAVRRRLEG